MANAIDKALLDGEAKATRFLCFRGRGPLIKALTIIIAPLVPFLVGPKVSYLGILVIT